MKKALLVVGSLVVLIVGGAFFGIGCAAPAYVAGKRPALSVSEGIKHEDGRLPVSGGVELYHQSWRTEGEPRGVLVVVHGLKDHGSRYAELAEHLAKSGFVVHAMDLRGHGDSSGDRVWVEKWDDYLSDVDTFVKHVQSKEGDKPTFVFGHSMGGAIVTTWALSRKPDVDGVILSGAALKPGPEVSSGLIAVTGFFSTVSPKLAVFELDDTKFSRDPKVVESMKTDPLVYVGNGPARTARELLGALELIGTQMEEFNYPVLLVHGAADVITPPEGSKELHAKAKSTDKTLKLYDGLYHDLLHEPERAKVIADIEAWLAAHAPATAPAAPVAETPEQPEGTEAPAEVAAPATP